jgi:hypothetical protein
MSPPVAPEIIARVSLLPAEAGGIGLPIRSGDFKTILTIGSESFSARVAEPEGRPLSPGASADVSVQFLVPDAALPRFQPGVQFKIWEGTDIGTGEVLGVVSTSNKSLERTREG